MGNIQNSINQALATATTGLGLAKHIDNQNTQIKVQALKDWESQGKEAEALKQDIDTQNQNIEAEKEAIETAKGLTRMDIRDPKGRFDTNEALENFRNELISESERAIKEAEDIKAAKMHQANLLGERMKLADKIMGSKNKDYLTENADKFFNKETQEFIHNIKPKGGIR